MEVLNYLVLVRHGQSEWNEKNLFTGWKDPDLTSLGKLEARKAGELIFSKEIDIRMPLIHHLTKNMMVFILQEQLKH